jgi:uncharacterized protein YkwD
MKTTIALLGLIAIFAGAAAAQSNSFQSQFTVNIQPGGDETRPRVIQPVADTATSASAAITASAEQIAFQMVNQKRADKGLQALVWSGDLEVMAHRHSQDMADNKYFGHRGLDGSMVSDRADRCGIGRWRAIGENIAYNRGYKEPVEKAVELWMESTAHRQNLLNDQWRESAVGVAIGADGSYYFTQVFLRK